MEKSIPPHYPKVFYRPIEAAIRWSGLVQREAHILTTLGNKALPDESDCLQWPRLRLNLMRLYDALRNSELPYGKAGLTCDDSTLLNHPELTIRHVDLKVWMSQYYPDQKPEFLFEGIERQLHPIINLDSVQALLIDREALKLRLNELEQSFQVLQDQHRLLSEKANHSIDAGKPITPRSESTYLSIVGGLLTLLLGNSPSGKPYSSFNTTESIISTLLAYYPARPGISERTLWAKFSAAKRHIADG